MRNTTLPLIDSTKQGLFNILKIDVMIDDLEMEFLKQQKGFSFVSKVKFILL